jgi:hypothetical protein
MGRHKRPQGARPYRDAQRRPRFGLAPLILAGAIVISYAVLRASAPATLMFAPPARPPAATSGIHPGRGPVSSPARPAAAGLAPATGARQAGTGGAFVSVACQFTSGAVCGVNCRAGNGILDGAGVSCSWANHIGCALSSYFPDLHSFSSWQCQG